MKEPKKAIKANKYLDEIAIWLEFALGELPKDYKDKIDYISEVLHDLSLDEKSKNRRLATKLKKEFEKEAKEHNKEIAEKAEKYDELVGKVQEVIDEEK
jgi:hypothetical protein